MPFSRWQPRDVLVDGPALLLMTAIVPEPSTRLHAPIVPWVERTRRSRCARRRGTRRAAGSVARGPFIDGRLTFASLSVSCAESYKLPRPRVRRRAGHRGAEDGTAGSGVSWRGEAGEVARDPTQGERRLK